MATAPEPKIPPAVWLPRHEMVRVRLESLALAVQSFSGVQMTPKTETLLQRARQFTDFALEGSSAVNGAGPQAAPPSRVANPAGTGPTSSGSSAVPVQPS